MTKLSSISSNWTLKCCAFSFLFAVIPLVGCSSSSENTVNQPEEVKTIEEQLAESKDREAKEAAEIAEQSEFN